MHSEVEKGDRLIGGDRDNLESESESESENESGSVDEREDSEGFEYQNMFCTSSTSDDVIVPDEYYSYVSRVASCR